MSRYKNFLDVADLCLAIEERVAYVEFRLQLLVFCTWNNVFQSEWAGRKVTKQWVGSGEGSARGPHDSLCQPPNCVHYCAPQQWIIKAACGADKSLLARAHEIRPNENFIKMTTNLHLHCNFSISLYCFFARNCFKISVFSIQKMAGKIFFVGIGTI